MGLQLLLTMNCWNKCTVLYITHLSVCCCHSINGYIDVTLFLVSECHVAFNSRCVKLYIVLFHAPHHFKMLSLERSAWEGSITIVMIRL